MKQIRVRFGEDEGRNTDSLPHDAFMNRSEMVWAYYRRKVSGCCEDELIAERNGIAEANFGLAAKAARRQMQKCNLPYEDLYQLACIGLLKAITNFNPAQGVAFSSFAMPYCEGEIQHFLRDHKGTVKVPRRWREKRDAVEAIQRKLAKSGDRLIQLDEIAIKGVGMDRGQWETIAHATSSIPCVSLDDEEAMQLADRDSLSLEEREQREALEDAVMQALSQLPEPDKSIVIEKFWCDLPDSVIAKRYGLTLSQLQSLLLQTFEQLRNTPCS